MSNKALTTMLKQYSVSGARSKLRQRYLRTFTPKMVYRTTKTEQPATTMKMVRRVLARMR